MFIQIAKKDLDKFNYNSNDDIKMLVPFTMINVAHIIYGQDNIVTISVEEMWNLVTRGKRKLRKAQRENLLDWFYWFTNNKDITFEDDFTFTVNQYKNEKFIKLDMKHIVNIFTEYRFDNIDIALAITLRLLSHMNGEYIGMSRNTLIQKIKHDYVGSDVFDIEKPNTWFQKYTMKDWNVMSSNLVAFPNIDDIIVKRYDTDGTVMDKPFIYEDNFNDHIAKLEKIGVICKVQTTYGKRRNKVVFCQVEHKEVVEQLYKRYDELVAFNIEHPNEDDIEEQPQPTKRSGKANGRNKRW